MNENAMNVLLQKIGNIENRQHALETEFIDYSDKNPKGNNEWFESRLRALEDQIKKLFKYCDDDRKKLENELEHSKWNEQRVDSLENQINLQKSKGGFTCPVSGKEKE